MSSDVSQIEEETDAASVPSSPARFNLAARIRNRLLTEETVKARNTSDAVYSNHQHHMMTMNDNPFRSYLERKPSSEEEEEEDESSSMNSLPRPDNNNIERVASDVSSISNDSKRRSPPLDRTFEQKTKAKVPREISIRSIDPAKEEVPEWQLAWVKGGRHEEEEEESTEMPPAAPPSPVWTGSASPAIPRPPAPKNSPETMQSAPNRTPSLKSRYDRRRLLAMTHRRSQTLPTIRSPTATSVASVSRTVVSRSPSLSRTVTSVTSPSLASSTITDHSSLLGNRPRRRDHRVVQSVFSFGSLVGESTMVTPTQTGTTVSLSSCSSLPTTRESATSASQRFQHTRRAREKMERLCSDSPRRTHRASYLLKKDLQHVWCRVATPIRRMAGHEEKPADLQRSSTGCLT